MTSDMLLLGVDGGGTNCRARLVAPSGKILGEAQAGPANRRLGLEPSFAAVRAAAAQCVDQAGLPAHTLKRMVACLTLAGASEPSHLAAAQARKHPFGRATITTDARAACVGAHGEKDGGIIVAGTGSIGWAVLGGKSFRVGGWGLPISDEGGGAWLGCEALRRVLWATDGRIVWTPLLRALFAGFTSDPHAIVRWAETASPRDFASFAPRVAEHSASGDPIAHELMRAAAGHIDALAARLIAAGAMRLGAGRWLRAVPAQCWLDDPTKARLVEPAGDALQGALSLARSVAQSRAPMA